jgi:hypothetical protein
MPLSDAERKAAQRRREARAKSLYRGPDEPDLSPAEESFWRAFPARPNDLAPSPEQLKRLGETASELARSHEA